MDDWSVGVVVGVLGVLIEICVTLDLVMLSVDVFDGEGEVEVVMAGVGFAAAYIFYMGVGIYNNTR